tara:strand:- start:979 stop:1200 length:222 start_codon:yes stop_codon:yes gene_type:complete
MSSNKDVLAMLKVISMQVLELDKKIDAIEEMLHSEQREDLARLFEDDDDDDDDESSCDSAPATFQYNTRSRST